jgi:catechol 2,3-dioxygenase-like lactoylglutathione lyase family enzyme
MWQRLGMTAVAVVIASPVSAQLSNLAAPVVISHYELNVTSVAEHKRFWVDTLGGKATKIGKVDGVEFPDAYILLRVQKPTGPTRGTTFDHIGFAVPDVPVMATKLAAAGYQETTGREPKPGEPPAATSGTSAVYGRFAYFVGPDGAKIELVTSDRKDAPPIVAHHIHFINKQYVEMQQWYMKAFNATLRPGKPTSSLAPTCPASDTASTSSAGKATSPLLTSPPPAAWWITWDLK